MQFEGLFHLNVNKAEKLFGGETFSHLKKVLDDFNAVLEGKYPFHAKVDKEVPLPTDDGPIISFDENVMRGNFPNIQHLTFYTGDDLQKLLRGRKKFCTCTLIFRQMRHQHF